MTAETKKLVSALPCNEFDALEISGNKWHRHKFKSYRSADFPEFDICKEALPDRFDFIAAEQVFEHLAYPYRAAKNVFSMLRPGGYFLVTTPFLVREHHHPIDCSRWTALGMRYFLDECGFPFDTTVVGSWGNRDCIIANFGPWVEYDAEKHSLANQKNLTAMVWALARKPQ